MSAALAKIWARLIYKGVKTIEDVPEEGVEAVKAAYLALYGTEL